MDQVRREDCGQAFLDAPDQLGQQRGWHGSAQAEALGREALHVPEHEQRGVVLDPFGDDLEP